MLKDSPNLGTGTVTIKEDPRVLPVGKFLRKTKINELPQLLNIFLGEMSVIGPRPLTAQTFSSYSDTTKAVVSQVRPGLSGVGSIIFRSEEDIMHVTAASVDIYHNVIAPYKVHLRNGSLLIKGFIFISWRCLLRYGLFIFKNKVAWIVFKGLRSLLMN